MRFLKKMIMALSALGLILVGGFSAQSGSLAFQGMGFVGLLVGLIILFIFTKMVWRAMGCLPSLFVVTGILVFILYAIGAFKNGMGGIVPYLQEFAGKAEQSDNREGKLVISEYFADEPESPADGKKQDAGGQGLPYFSSRAKVVSGDTLNFGGKLFRLYGIDAPEPAQDCTDKYGRPYTCGQKATRWLRTWINDEALDCQVVYLSEDGNMLGVCARGDYDLGAVMVNAGWAVAYTANTDVYVPYETQARQGNRGLWGGYFSAPWEWRETNERLSRAASGESKGFFGLW